MLMENKSKVLFFYPDNFLRETHGATRRVLGLLEYFKQRQFIVDFFSMSGYVNYWSEEIVWDKKDIEKTDLFRNIYICNLPKSIPRSLMHIWRDKRNRLFDYTAANIHRKFNEVVSQEKYDYVVITYVYWANLINHVKNASRILDLYCIATLEEYMQRCLHSENQVFTFGKKFQDEIQIISKFDYALSVSEAETLMLEQFCPNTKFADTPIAFPAHFQDSDSFEVDLLFVGGENEFNIEGIRWFVNKIYPLLPPTVSLTVVGTVCNHLKESSNIHLMNYVDNLADIYKKAKIVICPTIGGSGIKVKVVEALSYGKPVVTTPIGLMSILEKDNTGCVLADDEATFAQAINRLLTDKAYYKTVKNQAVAFFKKKFSQEACWGNLDSVFCKK